MSIIPQINPKSLRLLIQCLRATESSWQIWINSPRKSVKRGTASSVRGHSGWISVSVLFYIQFSGGWLREGCGGDGAWRGGGRLGTLHHYRRHASCFFFGNRLCFTHQTHAWDWLPYLYAHTVHWNWFECFDWLSLKKNSLKGLTESTTGFNFMVSLVCWTREHKGMNSTQILGSIFFHTESGHRVEQLARM